MSAHSDIDRLVAAWLESNGPGDVSGDVVAAACFEADGLRQRRAPWPIGPRPWPTARIGPSMRWATIAVAGLVLLPLTTALVFVASGGVDPSPTPRIAATHPVPEAIRGTWVAAQPANLTFGTPSGVSTMRLVIGSRAVSVTGDTLGDRAILASTAAGAPGARALELVALAAAADEAVADNGTELGACIEGDVGRYRWTVRSSSDGLEDDRGDLLDIVGVADGCAARAATLPTTWVRSLAADGTGGTGVLPVSATVVRATLPDGVYTAGGLASGSRSLSADGRIALGVWADPRPLLDPCNPLGGTAEKGSDAASFLAQLVRNPALSVEDTRPVDIGGVAATAADLQMPVDLTCAGAKGAEESVRPTEVYAWQAGDFETLPLAERTTIYLVRVPDHLLVIEVRAPDEPTRLAMLHSISFEGSLQELADR